MENKRRYFGGRLFIPKDLKNGKERSDENRLEKNVESAHLRAYLRGDKKYHHHSFGYDKLGLPIYKLVLEEWR